MNSLKIKLSLALPLLIMLAGNSPKLVACVQFSSHAFVFRDDVAMDRATGLIWKRCAVGMKWDKNGKQCNGRPTGLSHDDARKAAQSAGIGWRVPSGHELQTLRVDSCNGLKINTKVFPGVRLSDFGEGANFWTSTAALPGTFYYFNFTDGSVDFHSSGFALSTLLVRSQERKRE
ncbi:MULTISPECIES: DUF1566 domain-containing protein [unclassified Caballeronia]|uniref:Lcl C-terminal domain-containing protein n=1 Tax=unclassified Caballeronia TaxID=2646786 RepID=UPI00285B8623|nr:MULTISPECIES: DUF1566 domain-containing protein [unclassified Caballeronia]MDR5736531.1 DUF1566 domain-containing protein [Caballeronia sp. LZ016]MDR5810990.1 DUF1566 domain-containing protein [Caballeronia sp. LZ019]